MSTTRDRWLAFMAERGFSGNVLTQDAVKAAPEFAESEVRLALEPREAAPGLASAEKWLSRFCSREFYDDYETEEIDSGNPYRRCVFCKKSDPQINMRLDGHDEDCLYRKSIEDLQLYGHLAGAIAAELDRLRAELLRKDKVVGRAIDALQAVNLCGACEMQWVKALEMFHTSKPAPPAEREPNCEG